MADPNASVPPSPDTIDILTGFHAQAADMAENLRRLWLTMQADHVGLQYRDKLWQTACLAHKLSHMLDALGTMIAGANKYQTLSATPETAIDWHEAPIFPDAAPVPALPEGSSAL